MMPRAQRLTHLRAAQRSLSRGEGALGALGQEGEAGCWPGSSCSSTRSVGARMNTSHIMSGSCWLPLMKPITRRPVACSITASKRSRITLLELHPLLDHGCAAAALEQRLLHAREASAQHADDQVVLVVGLRAGRPAAVELLQQRDHPVRDRGQHVAVVLGLVLDRLVGSQRDGTCSRDEAPDRTRVGAMVSDRSSGSRPSPRARTHRRTREKAACRPPTAPLNGDALLAAVTEAMVAFHSATTTASPVTAKTLLLGDDLLACVLGGVYTDVEKTMIELQRTTIVQETRNAFQNAMQDKFIDAVERLSGRDVLAFISNHHVGPDIEIELFMLSPDGISDNRVPVVPEPDPE